MCDSREPEAGAGSVERREQPPSDVERLSNGVLLSRTTLELAIARAAASRAAQPGWVECQHHTETADQQPGWTCPFGCGAFVRDEPVQLAARFELDPA